MKKGITRKVGPLPLWAYAVILGGAFLAYRMLRPNKSAGGDASVQLIPTGAPSIDPSAGFLNELSMRLDRIESTTTAPPPASSDSSDSTLNFAAMLEAMREQSAAILHAITTKATTPAPSGGGSIQPVAPQPISAKPPPRVTDSYAAQLLQRMGAPKHWLGNAQRLGHADKVFSSENEFTSWVRRAATSHRDYAWVDGRVVRA